MLGKTGEKVSLLCLGGSHIGERSLSDEESIRIMRTAVDEGVNFFDNAYIYKRGRSEELMGRALRDGYRDKVFLMTKFYTTERDVESAREQLEESLRRLQTDYIDLWQVHQIHAPEHPRLVYENGLPEFMEKMREEGKVRYIGFTGHTRPEYHREMFERGYHWDTVQMPINPADHHWTSFEQSILPLALDKGTGVIAMKTMGGGDGTLVNQAGKFSARECLEYAMNLPVGTVCSGMDSMENLRENLETVRNFEPLAEEQVAAILSKAAPLADGGTYEPYKAKQLPA
jgi:aryl-alcohol dehydrogenase-like predicted oxidoreductase